LAFNDLSRKPPYAELDAFAAMLNYVDRLVADHRFFHHLVKRKFTNANLTICSFHLAARRIFTNAIYHFAGCEKRSFSRETCVPFDKDIMRWKNVRVRLMISLIRILQKIRTLIRKLIDKFETSTKTERERNDIDV